MQEKPMIITANHSITLTPSLIDLALSHARFYVFDRQTKLEHALRDRGSYRVQPEERTAIDPVLTLQREIKQSQAWLEQVEPLHGQLLRIFDLNFHTYAAVLRNARIALGQGPIDDPATMYSLRVVHSYMEEQLKSMNQAFSEAKFVQAINEER